MDFTVGIFVGWMLGIWVCNISIGFIEGIVVGMIVGKRYEWEVGHWLGRTSELGACVIRIEVGNLVGKGKIFLVIGIFVGWVLGCEM